MRDSWRWYLLLGALLVFGCLALPLGLAHATLYLIVACSTPVVIVVGALRVPRDRRAPWFLVAAGETCSAIGDGLYNWVEVVQHREPFPSVADPFYLAAFPLLGAGLWTMTRGRKVQTGGRLEIAVVTVSLALPLWVFLAGPVLDDSAPWLATACSVAYPVADLLLLSLLVRLVTVTGTRSPAVRLLVVGAAALPVADVAFALLGNEGWLRELNTLCWLTAFLCWGAAALHPSARDLPGVDVQPDRTVSWRRSGFLMSAGLVAPGMLVLEAAGLPGSHLWSIAAVSVLVIVLGVWRMHLSVEATVAWARRTERLRADMQHQSAHDTLTSLPNRATALDLLRQTQERARPAHRAVGVLVVDVDHLARVNEAHGERVGDDVLHAVARELERSVGAGDRVGRLGGDEFVVVVEDVEDETTLARTAERLTRLSLPLPGRRMEVTCSVGIAVQTPGRQVSTTELLHEAVTAAARAKAGGEGRTWFFDDVLRAELAQQADLERAMAAALVNDEFELHYQPVIEITTGRIRSFEALIRWNRPGHGMVRPDLFIPAAERSDLICDVGRWVLAEASTRLAAWRADGTVSETVRVAVNLSGRHLSQPGVVADVVEAIASAGLPPQAIVVEATETVLMDHDSVLGNLEALRDLGVGLSLDDFGTGYTSIDQLRTLPLETLKIDRSFVSSSNADEALVGLLVHCAHAFGLKVIAEGVETVEQLELLRGLGCDAAQGYYFSRPVPAAAVAGLMSGVRV